MTQPPAPYTDRTLPAPWALCDLCGSTAAGLPHPDGSPLCPECLREAVLQGAASRHLVQLVAPLLGAWGNHWRAAGLTLEQLDGITEFKSGAWANADHEGRLHRLYLRRAMSNFQTPQVEHAPPDRTAFDLANVPRLVAAFLDEARPAPKGGEIDRRLSFTALGPDGEAREVSRLSAGCDAVLIQNVTPKGEALLYFTGLHGHTCPLPTSQFDRLAYLVPADLLGAVRAALGGQFVEVTP